MNSIFIAFDACVHNDYDADVSFYGADESLEACCKLAGVSPDKLEVMKVHHPEMYMNEWNR